MAGNRDRHHSTRTSFGSLQLERCRFEAGQVYAYGLVQRSKIKCTGWQDYPLPDLLGSALCDDVQNPLLVAKTHVAHAV